PGLRGKDRYPVWCTVPGHHCYRKEPAVVGASWISGLGVDGDIDRAAGHQNGKFRRPRIWSSLVDAAFLTIDRTQTFPEELAARVTAFPQQRMQHLVPHRRAG